MSWKPHLEPVTHCGYLANERAVADEELEVQFISKAYEFEAVDPQGWPRRFGGGLEGIEVGIEQAQLVPEVRRGESRIERTPDIAVGERAFVSREWADLGLDPDTRLREEPGLALVRDRFAVGVADDRVDVRSRAEVHRHRAAPGEPRRQDRRRIAVLMEGLAS